MLTKKWVYRDPIGGRSVSLLKKVWYLGFQFDPHLIFSGHFRTVSGKASKATPAIGRLMPNLKGPSQSKRALLMSVMNSRLLYSSSTWEERAPEYAICRNLIIQPQRLTVLRVTRAYGTVTVEVALFLAELLRVIFLLWNAKEFGVK